MDILESMKSKEISFKFYMSLLQDLTDMMEEVELSLSKSSDLNSSSTCDIEKSDADTQETKEARNLKILLDLELELEESMCKIRKRMMVIRLIGLMSEDDILKDSLLNNSGKMIEVRIISVLLRYWIVLMELKTFDQSNQLIITYISQFIQCTIHRAAIVCQKREALNGIEKLSTDENLNIGAQPCKSEVTPDEVQSITTALGLLRNVIIGEKGSGFNQPNVKNGDWELLKLGLEDLEILQNGHGEKNIRSMAGKLRELISAHLMVMEQTNRVSCKT